MESQHLNLVLVLIPFLWVIQLLQFGSCFEFQVGDRAGWVVPPANQTKLYNDWASHERFKIGDIIRFKYKKDSLMEVNETDYRACNSSRPNFFSNKGDTTYTLDRSGFFYFISGATGHCEKGQRMIIWVIGQEEDSISSAKSSYASKNPIFSYGILLMAAFRYFG